MLDGTVRHATTGVSRRHAWVERRESAGAQRGAEETEGGERGEEVRHARGVPTHMWGGGLSQRKKNHNFVYLKPYRTNLLYSTRC